MSGQGQAKRPGITRREMLARTGALAGGVALAGAGAEQVGVSPIGRARAIGCGGVCIGAVALGGGAAIGYLMKTAADMYLGDERDYSGYTGADALHTEIYKGGLEMQSANERVMTGINNNIITSENVALAKGKAASIEEMNAGNGETAANNAMQAAIDGYYATIQQNILNHWNTQISQADHMVQQVANHSNISISDVFARGINGTGNYYVKTYAGVTDRSVTLTDGTSVTYKTLGYSAEDGTGATNDYSVDPLGKSSKQTTHYLRVYNPSGDGGSRPVAAPDIGDFSTTPDSTGPPWNALLAKRDDVNANLSGFVTDVYSAYDAGDIPTEDLVDPITASTQLQQDYDGYQIQGAHAAMLGIPTSAAQAVDIEVNPNTADATNLTVDIFTEHEPTDSDGNVVGFEAGKTYEPSTWSEPLYIAYEYTEEVDGEVQVSTDFIQLEDPFFIRDIVEKDGTSVNSFRPESQNTQTSDVAALEEELKQLREEQIRLQEEAEDTTGGGGGLLGGLGNLSTTALVAGGAGVAALLALTSG